ncbi:MAG: hypothetical protein H6861_06695 [Rhodospirillales bacterium]|nr:hypothetical protein [Rhodospirillales bacterium]
MRKRYLSFLIALAVICGFFFVIHSVRQESGRAQAAVGGLSVRTIARDVNYTRADKRAIRRAMLAGDEYLLSLKGADVRAVLDQPELVRRDLPTVVWQYRNEFCVLDVYFMAASAKVSVSPVVHYEIRARQKDVRDEDVQGRCLESMVRAQAGARFVSLDGFYKSN